MREWDYQAEKVEPVSVCHTNLSCGRLLKFSAAHSATHCTVLAGFLQNMNIMCENISRGENENQVCTDLDAFVPLHKWILIFIRVFHRGRFLLCFDCKAPVLLLTFFSWSDDKRKSPKYTEQAKELQPVRLITGPQREERSMQSSCGVTEKEESYSAYSPSVIYCNMSNGLFLTSHLNAHSHQCLAVRFFCCEIKLKISCKKSL